MPVQGKARKRPPRPKRKSDANLRKGGKVRDPVPVAPLREFFLKGLERGEFTVCGLAVELGWYRGASHDGRGGIRPKPGIDTTRVQRMLGVRGYSPARHKNGKRYGAEPRTHLNYDTAVLLCRAMGASPVDMKDPDTGESIL